MVYVKRTNTDTGVTASQSDIEYPDTKNFRLLIRIEKR